MVGLPDAVDSAVTVPTYCWDVFIAAAACCGVQKVCHGGVTRIWRSIRWGLIFRNGGPCKRYAVTVTVTVMSGPGRGPEVGRRLLKTVPPGATPGRAQAAGVARELSEFE
jgi:hypothetical protein